MNAPSFLRRLLPILIQAAGTADGSINRSRHGCSGMGKHEMLGKAKNNLELWKGDLLSAGFLKTIEFWLIVPIQSATCGASD